MQLIADHAVTAWSRWAVFVLLGGLLAGCAASSPVPSSVGSVLPPRPVEVWLDGLGPCGLADADVLRAAGAWGPARLVRRAVTHSRATACMWSDSLGTAEVLTLVITVAPDRSASDFLGEGTRVTTVGSFGAVETIGLHGNPQSECVLVIDVAEGQSLLVTVRNDTGWVRGINHEMMCTRAHMAGEAVLRQLLWMPR